MVLHLVGLLYHTTVIFNYGVVESCQCAGITRSNVIFDVNFSDEVNLDVKLK